MSPNYFYCADGATVLGPYTSNEIIDGYRNGSFEKSALICAENTEAWLSIESLIPRSTVVAKPAPAPKFVPVVKPTVDPIFTMVNQLSTDDQDKTAVEKVLRKATGLLTRDEKVGYIGVQKKPVVTIAPDAILLTNKRFMIVRPKLMGMTFDDHLWIDVDNVHLSEQFLSSTITCRLITGMQSSIDSIPKNQAKRIYAFAQEMEEEMRHARRERSIEEKRAAAGGIVFHGAGGHAPNLPAQEDATATLTKLKNLVAGGLITQEEFEKKKSEVLARL